MNSSVGQLLASYRLTPALAAEVMVKGFEPGGYLPEIMERDRLRGLTGVRVENVAQMFEPAGARDGDLHRRLSELVGEGLQVLEHESLIWTYNVSGVEAGYALTRRGRAALEADAVEQTLRGASAETA